MISGCALTFMRQLQQAADIGRVCGLHPETNSKKRCLEPKGSYFAVSLTIRNWKQNITKKPRQTTPRLRPGEGHLTSALFLSQVHSMHSRWAWHILAHGFAGVQDASGACREAGFQPAFVLCFCWGDFRVMFCTSTSMSPSRGNANYCAASWTGSRKADAPVHLRTCNDRTYYCSMNVFSNILSFSCLLPLQDPLANECFPFQTPGKAYCDAGVAMWCNSIAVAPSLQSQPTSQS